MSVFTTVTADELRAWLARYAVGSLTELKGISEGIENTNYFVTTSDGRFVLTLFEKLKAHELPFYVNLMAHLAARGIPCPRPIAAKSGALIGELNGKPAALVSFLPGRGLVRPDAGHCAQVGAALAQIHLAAQDYGTRMDNPRGPAWWRAIMPEIMPFLSAPDGELLAAEVHFQASNALADLPHGAIHGDLFRDNALFEGEQLAGIIDFYFACTDVLLYDVAIAVNDWCLDAGSRLDAQRTAALLDAYARVRPFDAAERRAWPVMLRAAALRFWVSRLYDFHLPRPGELTHAKDPDHFRQILANHIESAHALNGIAP